jgi:hypothetical protein
MFTVENGKMTSSNKYSIKREMKEGRERVFNSQYRLARPILERFYKEAINKKLAELARKNENTLWKILSDIFGDTLVAGNLEAKTKSLSEIGGDSLSAVRLSSVLSNTLNLGIIYLFYFIFILFFLYIKKKKSLKPCRYSPTRFAGQVNYHRNTG